MRLLLATVVVMAFALPSRARSHHRIEAYLEAEPCLDSSSVIPSQMKMPAKFSKIRPPWKNSPSKDLKIYKSTALFYQWALLKSMPVQGLNNTSVEEVLYFLKKQGCFFFPIGESVRELLMKRVSQQLTGEVSCGIQNLHANCVKAYGTSSCALYPLDVGGFMLEIGDATYNSSIDIVRAEPIVVYPWGTLFNVNSTSQWAYTVDAMGLVDDNTGHLFLIDSTGTGFDDTCGKNIQATVGKPQWEAWAAESLEKLLRFYELRMLDYKATSTEFQSFINTKILGRFGKSAGEKFYCERILKGIVDRVGDVSPATCKVVYPDNDHRKAIAHARNLMEEELGSYWNETLGSAINNLEAVYLTKKQFNEARHTLRKRVWNVTNEAVERNEIVEGKPMIKDIAEVHKRPIMAKSDAPNELPPDFPSSPNAKPNEELEFQDDVPIESKDAIAYESDDFMEISPGEPASAIQVNGAVLKAFEPDENVLLNNDEFKPVDYDALVPASTRFSKHFSLLVLAICLVFAFAFIF